MIIISPYSKAMRNGERNPKNYPYWEKLLALLVSYKEQDIKQIGTSGEIRLPHTCDFITDAKMESIVFSAKEPYGTIFMCVDNFMQHLCHYYKKPCIVLWGQSDPELFGYKENINLLKDRKYLRPNQFDTWENAKFNSDAFMSAQEVFNNIKHLL